MRIPRHRTFRSLSRLCIPGAIFLTLGIFSPAFLRGEDDIQDLKESATTVTTAPAEVTAPQTQPGRGVADALGTMKPKAPAGARIGLVTLNNGTRYEGRIWTTLETPFRVWIEELKTYRDVDFALVKTIDVRVVSQSMEPDWRWLKEGSDEKVYSGKKYPLVELSYKFTLLNDQIIEGPVVAPVFCFDGNKTHNLALYKKYKGKLDETLADVAYIQSLTLRASDAVTTANAKKTTKLPLLD